MGAKKYIIISLILGLFLFGFNLEYVSSADVGSSEDLSYTDPCGGGFTSMSSVLSAAGIDISRVDEVYNVRCVIGGGTLFCYPCPSNFSFCYNSLGSQSSGLVCGYNIGVKLYPGYVNPNCGSALPKSVTSNPDHTDCESHSNALGTSCCFGSLKTCSSVGGLDVCKSNEICPGYILTGSVDNNCCSVQCVQKTCLQMGGDVCTNDEVCIGEEIEGFSAGACCATPCVKESDLHCNSCSNCGDDFFNICDEDECKNSCALSEENGCVFTPRIVGGSCISTPIILVTECGVLNESGAIYKLQNDIYFKPYMPEFIDKTGGYCFYVIGDNITLDLNGYKISGNVFLEEDYEGIFCGGFGPDYSYACETSIFSSGEYDLLDFLFFSNYWGTESEEYNPQTPYYMHPPVGFGGVVVGGSNFELRRGIIDSFYNVGVYYNYEGKGESSNLIKDIGFDQTDVLVESRDSKIVLDIENSVFGQGPYIFDSSPGSYWADPVSDLYSSAVYQTFPVDLSFKNVSFDSMYSAVYLENTNLFVPYNFFSQNDNLPNNFYFNPSWGMSLGGNLSFVDNVRDPKISFTLINPTMESYDSSVLKNSIRFDGNVFDVFNERINFTAFPGLDVPTHVVNKNLFYNPPPKNYVFRFNLPDGGFIKIPSNFSFFENVSFNPYINFIYKGLEFCNSTVYLHCSGGKGCNAATYRCN